VKTNQEGGKGERGLSSSSFVLVEGKESKIAQRGKRGPTSFLLHFPP